jgi:hypothetical protein
MLQIPHAQEPDEARAAACDATTSDTLAGPMYAAAKASGRDKLPEIDKLSTSR